MADLPEGAPRVLWTVTTSDPGVCVPSGNGGFAVTEKMTREWADEVARRHPYDDATATPYIPLDDVLPLVEALREVDRLAYSKAHPYEILGAMHLAVTRALAAWDALHPEGGDEP